MLINILHAPSVSSLQTYTRTEEECNYIGSLFDDGINVSVSHLRFNYPSPFFDKSSSEDDINTSHNHTNIYPANALLMSHPVPGINSFPLLQR